MGNGEINVRIVSGKVSNRGTGESRQLSERECEELTRSAHMREAVSAAVHLCKKNAIESALAAPPRNCDVGTADEQSERFRGFCAEYRGHVCRDCPIRQSTNCELAWAQLPYEEGGAE